MAIYTRSCDAHRLLDWPSLGSTALTLLSFPFAFVAGIGQKWNPLESRQRMCTLKAARPSHNLEIILLRSQREPRPADEYETLRLRRDDLPFRGNLHRANTKRPLRETDELCWITMRAVWALIPQVSHPFMS